MGEIGYFEDLQKWDLIVFYIGRVYGVRESYPQYYNKNMIARVHSIFMRQFVAMTFGKVALPLNANIKG